MTEISYPDLQDVKENIPEVSAISLNTATNTKTKKLEILQTQQSR